MLFSSLSFVVAGENKFELDEPVVGEDAVAKEVVEELPSETELPKPPLARPAILPDGDADGDDDGRIDCCCD